MYSFQVHPGYHHTPIEPPPPAPHNCHQPHGTDLIGQPILFVSGQFAGHTIRAELTEVQQADLGRKYARVDRRPLDPPPVVQLRLFEVYNHGTAEQTEKEIADYDEVQVLGLLCTVDLFPVPHQSVASKSSSSTQTQRIQPMSQSQTSFTSSPQFSVDHTQHTFGFTPSHTYNTTRHMDSPASTHSSPSMPGYTPHSHPAPDTVHYVGDFSITEGSKMTQALVGATFVQPANIEFQGRKSIMFVFADLAVKIEGTFILRYRFFDIFSKPYNFTDLAIQAQCYGGVFRVYSTKEFPGLQASTELTKQLARWGVRLNTRETERKRRKKDDGRSDSPLYAVTGKRKHASGGGNTDIVYGSDED